ncbi:hypothetical protein OKC48_04065 [Methylorubrum extorquens]|uniref:hypothetical protein n=1 Tax=Methylorubrum extorquens TaxID=408 RepID=UPI00223889F6|nr:hypothetical protein [Methylorubrum extorquens]UYW27695.1 hypothetical protein OKC48_04065 [Methylorubrum extorquens]
MSELFHFPPAAAEPANNQPRTRAMIVARISSHVVSKPSAYGKDVEYARLSEADHAYVRSVIETLWDHRTPLRQVMDKASGLFGRRNQSRQTQGEVLEGLREKLAQPHPVIRGRKGEDFTLKQLSALNKIIDDVNALLGDQTIEHVTVPKP